MLEMKDYGPLVQQEILVEEQIETALEFLQLAEKELNAGDIRQGSGKLWGAAAHAPIAKTKQLGWAHGSHRELTSAVNNYAARINDPSHRWLFGLAEKFHRNFYNNTMPQFEIDSDRHGVALFLRRMVDLTRTAGG